MSSNDDQKQQASQGVETKKVPTCTLCSKLGHAQSKCTRLSDIKRFWSRSVPVILNEQALKDTVVKALHCALCNSLAHNGGKCPASAFSRENYATLVKLDTEKARGVLEADKLLLATVRSLFAEIAEAHEDRLAQLDASAEDEEPPKKNKKDKKDGAKQKHARDEAQANGAETRTPKKRKETETPRPRDNDDDATVLQRRRKESIPFPRMVAPATDSAGRVVGAQTRVCVSRLVKLGTFTDAPVEGVERTASWLTAAASNATDEDRLEMVLDLVRGIATFSHSDQSRRRFRVRLVPMDRDD